MIQFVHKGSFFFFFFFLSDRKSNILVSKKASEHLETLLASKGAHENNKTDQNQLTVPSMCCFVYSYMKFYDFF